MATRKQYCVFCGKENDIEDQNCIHCKKRLNPKESPFLDYLKSKIKDKYVGEVKDNIYSILLHYIKSHLYGFILTCSVLVSAASVITNHVVNTTSVQNVVEKPVVIEKIRYEGEGLQALEVAQKYVRAIQENDQVMIKSLQLETFYPKVWETLKGEITDIGGYGSTSFIQKHDLIAYASYYFKYNQGEVYIGESELVADSGNYGEYPFRRFQVSMGYCSYNTCQMNNGYVIGDFYARDEIELIEIDGNYYVSGEQPTIFMGQDEWIKYRAFMNAKGDTTNLDFAESIKIYDQCNEDESCLRMHGFVDE